jgi:hypothetical protein
VQARIQRRDADGCLAADMLFEADGWSCIHPDHVVGCIDATTERGIYHHARAPDDSTASSPGGDVSGHVGGDGRLPRTQHGRVDRIAEAVRRVLLQEWRGVSRVKPNVVAEQSWRRGGVERSSTALVRLHCV